MKIKIALLFVISVAALLACLKFESSSKQSTLSLRDTLSELHSANASLDKQLLRSRFDLANNYDQLAQQLDEVELLNKKLEQQLNADSNAQLVRVLGSYREAIEVRHSAVENFKSHNSVLRNSRRYAPLAIEKLLLANQSDNNWPLLVTQLAVLKGSLLEYSLTSRPTVKVDLQLLITDVKNQLADLPQHWAQPLGGIVNHAEVVLREQATTNRYMDKVISSRASASLDEAMLLVDQQLSEQQQLASQQDQLTLGYVLLVLLLLIALLWDLRKPGLRAA